MAQPARKHIIIAFPQLPSVVFADRVEGGVGRSRQQRVETAIEQVIVNDPGRQAGDRRGKGQVVYLLMIAPPSVVNRYHGSAGGEIVAKAFKFADQGREQGGMTIVAVDYLGSLIKPDHQG